MQEVEQDDTIALEWYLKTSEHHYSMAEFRIGMAYLEGDGVSVDKSVTEKWFDRAIKHEDVVGGWSLYAKGCLYLKGGLVGLTQDLEMAYECFLKSAE